MMDEQEKKPLPRIRTFETDVETRKKEGVSPSDVVARSGILNNGNTNSANLRKIIIIAILMILSLLKVI